MILEINKNKQQIFQKTYKLGFGVENTSHTIQKLYMVLDVDEKPRAMFSGYELDKDTFYIQFGTRFSYKNTDETTTMYGEFLDHLKKKYNFVICYVENDKIPSLILQLRLGLKIIGMRKVITSDKIVVEFYKDLRENKCQNI